VTDYISTKASPEEKETAKRLAAEWARDSEVMAFLLHNSKSVELIKSNAARGMSRPTMIRIWGERLVRAVVG